VVIGGSRGYQPPQLAPVEGVGFGLLELEGEAHGVVGVASIGAAMVRNLAGEATGASAAAGQGEAACGQSGSHRRSWCERDGVRCSPALGRLARGAATARQGLWRDRCHGSGRGRPAGR
jgi:hypothetical protein